MKTTPNDGATSATVDRVASGAHQAVDKIADVTHHAADSLSHAGHQVKQMQEKWLENIRDYVHKNPVKSLGIAVAGGYLLSRILNAR